MRAFAPERSHCAEKGDAMGWRQVSSNQNNPIDPWIEQEIRLLEQARSGSERAFSALVARYQNPVFRLIYHLVGDEDEARDLAYVALRNAFRHTPRIPAGYSIRPWILRIASLVALDALRDRKNTAREYIHALQLESPKDHAVIVDSDPEATKEMPLRSLAAAGNKDADIWEMLPVDIERNLIRRLLSELPEYDAELLSLGVIGDTSTRDLAAMYNTTQRNIRRRMARALIVFHRFYQSVRYDTQLPGTEEVQQLQERSVSSSITAPLEFARKGLNDAKDAISKGVRSLRENLNAPDLQKIAQSITSAFAISAISPIGSDISEHSADFEDGDANIPPKEDIPAPHSNDPSPETQDVQENTPQIAQTAIRPPHSDISAAETVIQPPPAPQDSGAKQESSGFSTLIRKLTKPLTPSQTTETIIAPQLENQAQPVGANTESALDATMAARKLPRFGPPSEEVIPFNVVTQADVANISPQDSFAPDTLQSAQISHADVQESLSGFAADAVPIISDISYSHDLRKMDPPPEDDAGAALELGAVLAHGQDIAEEQNTAAAAETPPEDDAGAALELGAVSEHGQDITEEQNTATEAETPPEDDAGAALEPGAVHEHGQDIAEEQNIATETEIKSSPRVSGDNADLAFLQRADFAAVEVESEEFNPSVSSAQVRRFGFDPADEDEKFTTLPQGIDLADLRHTVEKLRNSDAMQKQIDNKQNGTGTDISGKDLQ